MITVLNLIQLAAALAAGPERGVLVERQAFAMGTVLRVEVEATDRASGVDAIEGAFAAVRRLDGILSSWRADSEVGALNAAPVDVPVELSGELAGWLARAGEWVKRTNGAFDPAVGALIDAWDFRGAGHRPSQEDLRDALSRTGFEAFELDGEGSTVRRRTTGAWLDTGGFGKGAALDAAAAELRRQGIPAATLDFGGQLLVFGGESEGVEVAIAHPARREVEVCRIRLASGSVATSGQSERYVEVDGERFGHILDPRNGLPVPAWGSVTVVAPDGFTADILSTALFVLGPAEGMRLAETFEQVAVLFLEERGGELVSSGNSVFEEYRSVHPSESCGQ